MDNYSGHKQNVDLSRLPPEAQRRAAYLVHQLGLLSSPNSVPNYSAIGGDNDGTASSAASSNNSSVRSSIKKSRTNMLSSSVPSSRKNSRTSRKTLIYCIHGNKYEICCASPDKASKVVADSKGILDAGGEARIDMGGILPFPGGSGGREQDGEGGSTAISRGNSSSDLHCHETQDQRPKIDKKARNKLFLALALCLTFMTVEFVGGFLANSLAIMTDAFHLLSDFAAFLISLIAIHMAGKPSSAKYNYGWHRMEVVGAVISVLIIWVLTGSLLAMAVIRLVNRDWDDIDAVIMLITSGIGVAVNLIMGFSLHGGGHGHSHGGVSHSHGHSHGGGQSGSNINVRAAMIHVIGDFIQSVGVLVAALFIYFIPSTGYLDPVCTILFSLIVLYTTFRILGEVFSVLMEAIPRGVDFNVVKETFLSVEGIRAIHNVRIWGLTTEKFALSAHLAIENGADPQEVLKEATLKIREKYDFFEMTLQVENFMEEMNDCKQCENP